VPTRVVAERLNAQIAKAYWFFLLHQVPDLPEVLIAGKEREWLRHFFADWCYDPTAISGEAFEEYVRAYLAPCAARFRTTEQTRKISRRTHVRRRPQSPGPPGARRSRATTDRSPVIYPPTVYKGRPA
jgi:hypothetical protein